MLVHNPTSAEVRQAIMDADFVSLVLLIPARTDHEFDWWLAYRCEFGTDRFPCPRCQLPVSEGRRPSIMRLDARVVTDFEWKCEACRVWGTRFEIERLILEDPIAMDRLLLMSRQV